MLKEFREFAMKGNVLDMAIGIIIGAAFGKIVSSFVADVLMPPLGMLMGKVDFTNWFGLLARTGTPQPILDKLAKAAVSALKDSQMREVVMSQAAEPVGNTPTEFRDFIRAESVKYAKIVALTGIKVK